MAKRQQGYVVRVDGFIEVDPTDPDAAIAAAEAVKAALTGNMAPLVELVTINPDGVSARFTSRERKGAAGLRDEPTEEFTGKARARRKRGANGGAGETDAQAGGPSSAPDAGIPPFLKREQPQATA